MSHVENLLQLPTELLDRMLGYLDLVPDLWLIMRVCKHFHGLCFSARHWRDVSMQKVCGPQSRPPLAH